MQVPNQLYIAGQWRPSSNGERIAIVNPATETVVDSVPKATTSDVASALDAAASGFRVWRATSAWDRSGILRRVAELIRMRAASIAEVMTLEQGKPLTEARLEVLAAAEQFDWYADEARRVYGRLIDGHSRDRRLFVGREPIGPVAAFTPWNFPAVLPARKLAPALAAGCSVILKPAQEAPRTSLCLAQACDEAGLPAGVLNVVTGDSGEISSQLIASDVIRKVSLTGSVPVGRELMRQCSETIKPITLELGGHAPVLVFSDTDVTSAARRCVQGKFRNCGQVCASPSRFFVEESISGEFIDAMATAARALKVGPGLSASSDVGPLSNERRRETVESLVADAVGKGATVRAGGRRPPGASHGFFYEPTVLSGATDDMSVMRVEPFGPIAPVSTFGSEEEAVSRANATPYGLAAFVFTEATSRAMRVSEALEVGMVGVNSTVIAAAEAPFGGVKLSGFGREGGVEGMDAYLISKYVNIALS